MTAQRTGPWSAAEDQTLRKFWMLHDAKTVANLIGTRARKAVIGRAHRLGLPDKRNQTRPPRTPRLKTPPAQKRVRRPLLPLAPPSEPLRPSCLDLTPTRTLETLNSRECRFPTGDVGDPNFGFCGRPAVGSYCTHHRRIAYVPAPKRARPQATNTGQGCNGEAS